MSERNPDPDIVREELERIEESEKADAPPQDEDDQPEERDDE